jgi:hypothetical protein
MHTTEKHHSADDRTLTEAELDQVSAGTFWEYVDAGWNVGTVPYQTGKLGSGLRK